jgi:D-alanyl-lipoteichoic acid acyltransferase DltB (MBOAT superfamily)
MLFNSLPFLLLFLPVAFLGFHLSSRVGARFGAAWLVAMSLLFYFWWNPPYLFLLLGSITANYAFGLLIRRLQGKGRLPAVALTIGVAFNLLLLCYYKYFFPILNGIEGLGVHLPAHPSSVILPLGISFFTFTQIGYLVDCKDGISQGRGLLNYSLFVTFFPHLIAGPILHHKEVMPQFREPATYRLNLENIRLGLSIFLLGLAKKTLIADVIAPVADKAFQRPEMLSAISSWHGVLCYSLQLYFDFSGYSEMAIGLALLFNIRFPANFDSPYKSLSIIEFWQRWHISLTRYITLYIYNPIALSMTRRRQSRGLPTSRKALKTPSGFLPMVMYPTFVTMLLAGIWHGAGLQYIIFGLLHAVYLTINHIYRLWRHTAGPVQPARKWHVDACKVLLTYLAVLVAQIFFRASSTRDAIAMLKAMMALNPVPVLENWRLAFGFDKGFVPSHILASIQSGSLWAVMILFVVVWGAPNILQLFADYRPALTEPKTPWDSPFRWQPNCGWAVALGLVGGVAFLAVTGTTVFLYFQF